MMNFNGEILGCFYEKARGKELSADGNSLSSSPRNSWTQEEDIVFEGTKFGALVSNVLSSFDIYVVLIFRWLKLVPNSKD